MDASLVLTATKDRWRSLYPTHEILLHWFIALIDAVMETRGIRTFMCIIRYRRIKMLIWALFILTRYGNSLEPFSHLWAAEAISILPQVTKLAQFDPFFHRLSHVFPCIALAVAFYCPRHRKKKNAWTNISSLRSLTIAAHHQLRNNIVFLSPINSNEYHQAQLSVTPCETHDNCECITFKLS